jgi:anti-sigma regulatory factor (Ser/Thr protein kinase)
LVRFDALERLFMYLELSLRPTVQIITVIRRSVMSLYERILDDSDLSARIGLATHELLENVIRHSVNGETILHIRADVPSSKVTVETRSRATEESIEDLKALATTIRDTDPDEYYQEAMTASLTSDKEGGLGLARIRAEGGMTVDVRNEGDCLFVMASASFGKAA